MQKVNTDHLRTDFPILSQEIHPGVSLTYLDSAATSQKPSAVINAMTDYYLKTNANIHRGVHALAEEATQQYEQARVRIAKFINAKYPHELVYTRNTTESINLVAQTWGEKYLTKDSLILLTEMEHHSNLVPWYMLAEKKGCTINFIPILDDGTLDMQAYDRLLDMKPALVAFTHMSNVLGTINPAREMTEKAHRAGAVVLIDAAQSVPHFSVDVQEINADFMAFSAHKMAGPTGIGILYGKQQLLNALPPFLGGGDMIKKVTFESFTPNDLPHKFEAGTPAIAEAIGFGAAVDYLQSVGMDAVHQHETDLTAYAMDVLQEVPGLVIYGPESAKRGGVVSFSIPEVHPHDIAQLLDRDGIAVRAGHHCAMPLHQKLQLTATTRASFYLYNTNEEIDRLVVSLLKVQKMFS